MQHLTLLTAALAVVAPAIAQSVSGTPEGFAAGTTGGADGETVTPSTIDELVSYLESSEPYTVVLTQEFDFTGSEGTTTETGCAPWGTSDGCQTAINGASDWCGRESSDSPAVEVTYDVAGTNPIQVASDKTILGVGSAGVIRGKGLQFNEGTRNVIVQNIEITELNPQYVWGGDALSFNGVSNIWIDHVKVSLIGRMFVVTHYTANTGITISNSEFDGQTSWSASCDGYHYWTLFLTGDGDEITFKNNYVHHTSGRSPKVNEGSFVHIVNNYWYENSGHCFEGEGGYVLVEGNTFENVVAMEADFTSAAFGSASDSDSCESALGRACMGNAYVNTPEFEHSDTSVLDLFSGLEVADAVDASSATSAADSAGNTLSGSDSTSSNVVDTSTEEEEIAADTEKAVESIPAATSSEVAPATTSTEVAIESSGVPASTGFPAPPPSNSTGRFPFPSRQPGHVRVPQSTGSADAQDCAVEYVYV